eukprot:UN32613
MGSAFAKCGVGSAGSGLKPASHVPQSFQNSEIIEIAMRTCYSFDTAIIGELFPKSTFQKMLVPLDDKETVDIYLETTSHGHYTIYINDIDPNIYYSDDSTEIFQPELNVKLNVHKKLWKIAKIITKEIALCINNRKKITVTGCFVGGAVAIFVTLLLRQNEFSANKCVVFGSPNVLEQKGIEYIEQKFRDHILIIHDTNCNINKLNNNQSKENIDGFSKFSSSSILSVNLEGGMDKQGESQQTKKTKTVSELKFIFLQNLLKNLTTGNLSRTKQFEKCLENIAKK